MTSRLRWLNYLEQAAQRLERDLPKRLNPDDPVTRTWAPPRDNTSKT